MKILLLINLKIASKLYFIAPNLLLTASKLLQGLLINIANIWFLLCITLKLYFQLIPICSSLLFIAPNLLHIPSNCSRITLSSINGGIESLRINDANIGGKTFIFTPARMEHSWRYKWITSITFTFLYVIKFKHGFS